MSRAFLPPVLRLDHLRIGWSSDDVHREAAHSEHAGEHSTVQSTVIIPIGRSDGVPCDGDIAPQHDVHGATPSSERPRWRVTSPGASSSSPRKQDPLLNFSCVSQPSCSAARVGVRAEGAFMVDLGSWTRQLHFYPRREPMLRSPVGSLHEMGPRRLFAVGSAPQLDIFHQSHLKQSRASLHDELASPADIRSTTADSRASLWERGFHPPSRYADCWAEGGIRSLSRSHSNATFSRPFTGHLRRPETPASDHFVTTSSSYGGHYKLEPINNNHQGSLSLLRYPPMHQAPPFGVIR